MSSRKKPGQVVCPCKLLINPDIPPYMAGGVEGGVMTQVKATVNYGFTLIYGHTFRAHNSLYPYPHIAVLNPFFLETPIF